MNTLRQITSNYHNIDSYIRKLETKFYDTLDANIKRVRSTNLNKRINVVREILEEYHGSDFDELIELFHSENSTIDNAYDDDLIKNINELITLYIKPIKERLVNLACERLVEVYELRLEKETTDLDIFVYVMNYINEQEKEIIDTATQIRQEIVEGKCDIYDISKHYDDFIETYCGTEPVWRGELRDKLNYNYSYFLKKNGFEYYLMFIETPVKEIFRTIIGDKLKKIFLNI